MAAGPPTAHGGRTASFGPMPSLGIYSRLTQSCINARKLGTGR
jgi:hypothetical protein